jgi:hypothetical protein
VLDLGISATGFTTSDYDILIISFFKGQSSIVPMIGFGPKCHFETEVTNARRNISFDRDLVGNLVGRIKRYL